MPSSDEIIEIEDSLPIGDDQSDTLVLSESQLASYATEAFKAGPEVPLDVDLPKLVAGLMLKVQLSCLLWGEFF